MTERRKTLATVKNEIRSLIESSGQVINGSFALSANQISRDYLNMMGKPLPYQELGYQHVAEMFNDMPDTVHLSYVHGTPMLNVIVDEKTQHLANMISRHKPSKKRDNPFRVPPPTRIHNPHFRPNFGQYSSAPLGGPQRMQTAQVPRLMHLPITSTPQNSVLISTVRGRIKTLTTGNPQGIDSEDFRQMFYRHFNEEINLELLGFKTLYEFMSTIGDIVNIDPPNGKGEGGRFKILPKQLQGSVQQASCNSPKKSVFSKKKTIKEEVISPSSRHKLKEILVAKGSRGIKANTLLSVVKDITGEHVNLAKWGYPSVVQWVVNDLSDFIRIEQEDNVVMLYDINTSSQPQIQKRKSKSPVEKALENASLISTSTAPPISPLIVKLLCQVIFFHNNSVDLRELPRVFQGLTGDRLNHSMYGYASLHLMIEELKDFISCEPVNGVYKLNTIETSQGTDLLRFINEYDNLNHGLPVDVCGAHSVYRSCVLHLYPYIENCMEAKTYVFFRVCEVNSPDDMWLQLASAETTGALETLMDRLEETYKTDPNSEAYKMPDSAFAVGALCAGIFPDVKEDWHRCLITDLKPDRYVEVFYVDYGSTSVISRDQIRLLKNEYLELPTQGIQGRLCGIEAPGDMWPEGTKEFLLELCAEKKLCGVIHDIDQDNKLSVAFVDTTGDKDIHLNVELISRGFAQWCHIEIQEIYRVPLPTDNETYEDVFVILIDDKDEQKCPYVPVECLAILTKHEDIRQRLRADESGAVDNGNLMISLEDYPLLFEDMKNECVPGILDSSGAIRKYIVLYSLDVIPVILDLLEFEDREISNFFISMACEVTLTNPGSMGDFVSKLKPLQRNVESDINVPQADRHSFLDKQNESSEAYKTENAGESSYKHEPEHAEETTYQQQQELTEETLHKNEPERADSNQTEYSQEYLDSPETEQTPANTNTIGVEQTEHDEGSHKPVKGLTPTQDFLNTADNQEDGEVEVHDHVNEFLSTHVFPATEKHVDVLEHTQEPTEEPTEDRSCDVSTHPDTKHMPKSHPISVPSGRVSQDSARGDSITGSPDNTVRHVEEVMKNVTLNDGSSLTMLQQTQLLEQYKQICNWQQTLIANSLSASMGMNPMMASMNGSMANMLPGMGGMNMMINSTVPNMLNMGGGMPQMGGGVPQMGGGLPQMGGGVPQMGGGLPQMGGGMGAFMPQMGAAMPQMGAGMLHMNTLNPQIGANMSQMQTGIPNMGSGMPNMGSGMLNMGTNMPQMGANISQMNTMPQMGMSQMGMPQMSMPQMSMPQVSTNVSQMSTNPGSMGIGLGMDAASLQVSEFLKDMDMTQLGMQG